MAEITGFGARLRTIREKAGLTQRELSEQSGVSHISISRIESGNQQPNLRKIEQLADALQLPVNQLLKSAIVVKRGRGRPVRRKSA